MFPTIAYPILVTAGVGALWLVDRSKNQKVAPVAPPPQPNLNPMPGPPPALDPNAAVAAATLLVQQAATNPAAVDTSQMGALVATLRANGQTQLAGQVEAAGPIVCAAQGKPPNCWQTPVTGTGMNMPAPTTATPGAIPPLPPNLPALGVAPVNSAQAGYQATIAAARLSLASVPLDRLQRFAKEARGSNLPAEAAWLEALAVQRAALGETPGQAALRAQYAQTKANPPKNLAIADDLVRQLGAAGLITESMDLAAFVERLKAQRAAGLPADAAPPNPNASTLSPDLVARMNQLLNDPNADPVKIGTLVATIQMNYPGGFLTQITQLQKRADELRQMGR